MHGAYLKVIDLPVDFAGIDRQMHATRPQLLTESGNALSRSNQQSIPHASAERLCSAISNEKAQMKAYDALADQAYAEARDAQQRMQQDLDQVHVVPRAESSVYGMPEL